MKVNVEVTCTPEEARAFMGLPDIKPMQDRIMNAIVSSLAPGGQFVGFAYSHARYYPTTVRFRRLMQEQFARFETTPIIWRNVPPAYIYRCWKAN